MQLRPKDNNELKGQWKLLFFCAQAKKWACEAHKQGVIKMLKPLADHVIVEVVEVEEKTASGIFLPDTAVKEKPQQGKVLAVGRGKYSDNGTLIKPEVKVGDEVIFAKYSGTPVKHQGKDYLILSERDILATIEK